MIKPRVRSQTDIRAWLESLGFQRVGEISVSEGDFSVWVSDWGEPLMIPEAGPDRVCADFILRERVEAVMATKPHRRR